MLASDIFRDLPEFKQLLFWLNTWFKKGITRGEVLKLDLPSEIACLAAKMYKRNNVAKPSYVYQIISYMQIFDILSSLKNPLTAIIIDQNLAYLYPRLQNFLIQNFKHLIFFSASEQNKNIYEVKRIIHQLPHNPTALIVIGGGITTDLGAFVASLFKTKLFLFPTTLLAQIDASIGGKTGVNHAKYGKNQIGQFYFADNVYIAPEFIKTLSDDQRQSACLEMLKMCYIAGKFAEYRLVVEDLKDGILNKETNMFIDFCLFEKVKIVKSDPYETGTRTILNLGHTLGHAIESYITKRKGHIAHGIAVGIGLLFMHQQGYLNYEDDFWTMIKRIVLLYLHKNKIDLDFSQEDFKEALINYMLADKKNQTLLGVTFSATLPGSNEVRSIYIEKNALKIKLRYFKDLQYH